MELKNSRLGAGRGRALRKAKEQPETGGAQMRQAQWGLACLLILNARALSHPELSTRPTLLGAQTPVRHILACSANAHQRRPVLLV